MKIIIKTPEELDLMRQAGKIVGNALKLAEKQVYVGQTSNNLNKIIEDYILSQGATPSFKGYNDFPFAICASKNDEIVHGFCDDVPLKNGDIISIDVGAKYKGFHSDAARTFAVGSVSNEVKRLIEVTEQSFFEGLQGIKEGCKLGNISSRIQRYVENNGFSIVREMAGHGVGKDLHEDPIIPNYGSFNAGPVLKEGMVIAVEPMVNMGKRDVAILDNDWTLVTQDGKPASHYENTVIILKEGIEILTN